MAATYTRATLRTAILRRVDHETTGYFSTDELNRFINDSVERHHDLLISVLGEEYALTDLIDAVGQGEVDYELPEDFYKPVVIYALTDIGWVPILRFELQDQILRTTNEGPSWMPRVHLMGLAGGARRLKFDPPPEVQFNLRLVYHALPPAYDADSDEVTLPYPELLILDVAIKCMQRQRKDAAELIAERTQLRADIESMHAPADRQNPPRVIDVTRRPRWPTSFRFDASLLPVQVFEVIKIRASIPQSVPHLGTVTVTLDVTEFNGAESMTAGANVITLQKTGYYLLEWEAYWEEGTGTGIPGPKYTRPMFDGVASAANEVVLTVAGGDKSFGKPMLIKVETTPFTVGLQAFQEDTVAAFEAHTVQCALAMTRLGDL